MAPPFASPRFIAENSKAQTHAPKPEEKPRLAYPLGKWVSGKFVFNSPEAEQQWREDSYRQATNDQTWMKGRRLGPEEHALADLGIAHSDDNFTAPDGIRYQSNAETQERDHLRQLRGSYLTKEPAEGSAFEMGVRAITKSMPAAIAMMAVHSPMSGLVARELLPPPNDNYRAMNENSAPTRAAATALIKAQPSALNPKASERLATANDNRTAANENSTFRTQTSNGSDGLQLAQEFMLGLPEEFVLPEGMTPLEELPPGSSGEPGAGKPFPPSTMPKEGQESPPCIYCNKPTERQSGPTKYHRDHIIPRSQGGNNGKENLGDSCQNCNLRKGPRTPAEWYRAQRWMPEA